MWQNLYITTPYLTAIFAMEDAAKIRCCIHPAALLPYPNVSGVRPAALRPTLSSGLPFSSFELVKKTTNNLHAKIVQKLYKNKENK
jgi:hypothetical protein